VSAGIARPYLWEIAMTRPAAILVALAAVVSASALLAAGPRQDAASGGISPFDPAAGGTSVTAPEAVDRKVGYFPDGFPNRGRTGVESDAATPTF
jgi:hypothetical protein